MTMVHEAGHAFHGLLCAGEPLVEYRSSPTEFAEVASMSMEHLTMPYWGVPGGFYATEEDLRRARAEHLEHSVAILAWIAAIDSFQRWMYANPGHTRRERDDEWVRLDERFGHPVSWDGLTEERRARWQQQGHLYSHALYYIEYGIAGLGALRLWLTSRAEGERAAVEGYIRALSLGGSKPLPELFATAGLGFDFGEGPVAEVCAAVEAELGRLAD
jgi:oligoendopeptidase F